MGVVSHLRLLASSPPQVTPDEACLEAFQRELNYVHRTLRRMGTSVSEVEDLLQDVFLALRRSWSDYDQRRPLRPYLFGIMFRLVSANQRKRKREVTPGMVEPYDNGLLPDEVLESKQARAMILAALERIPLPRRAVLMMYDLDSVPIREIASVLAIPMFTAYSRLRKARQELEIALRRLAREADVR